MDPNLSTWIAIPLLGCIIGYITNMLAVKMIFRPIKPVNILGFKLQGLIGRRQQDLAKNIGRVVGSHLVEHKDVVESLSKMDFEDLLVQALNEGLGSKIAELRSLPLIGGFLTDERIDEIRNSFVQSMLKNKDKIIVKLEEAVEKGLDVPGLVEEKVAAFPITQLEEMILEVASRELRAIVILGGVLGLAIGLCQAGLVTYLN